MLEQSYTCIFAIAFGTVCFNFTVPRERKEFNMEKEHEASSSNIINRDYKEGAEMFEKFWLQPKRYRNKEVSVRLRLNKKLGGWKLKDDLVQELGLSVGDCINTEVSVLLGPGIIDDNGDTDLFADGQAAEWLIDTVLHNKEHPAIVEGCVIDCVVRLVYGEAPVGRNNKNINKISLILVRGIRYHGYEEIQAKCVRDDLLAKLLNSEV